FAMEAGLFEHAGGRAIRFERLRENPLQVKRIECEPAEPGDRLGHDPTAPERLAKPVAQLRGLPMNIVSELQSNASNRLRRCCQGERGFGPLLYDEVQKRPRFLQSVGEREDVAQVDPYLAIVRI